MIRISHEMHLPSISINRDACIRCGACDELCPTDVIRTGSDGYPSAVYAEDCQACFFCEWDCPVGAIKISVRRWFKPDTEQREEGRE
jgi:NAD-dependent dihydropyrimidine dehydrogenase PreA subunit